jgi:AGCS family alanine or glycine:cation symporter
MDQGAQLIVQRLVGQIDHRRLAPLVSVQVVADIQKRPLCLQRESTGRNRWGGFLQASVMMGIRMGVARGVFSNESGLGSAPIAAAAAQTKHPVTQALVSMTQTFIDTIVVCTMTGLVIIMTGAWTSGDTGAELTSMAFRAGFTGGAYIVTVGLILFAYSTILGWSYYGEKSIEYLFGEKAITPYRYVFILVVGVGAVAKLDFVWSLSDTFNGLMAIPNLIGLLALSPVIAKTTRDYFQGGKAT